MERQDFYSSFFLTSSFLSYYRVLEILILQSQVIRHLYNDFFRHFFTVLHKNVPVSGYSGKCGFLSAEIEGKIEQQSNILSFVSYDRFLSIDLD